MTTLIRYTGGDTLATGPHGTMHNEVADLVELLEALNALFLAANYR
jgi:hypothetical protein